ncbi:Rid family hydrolase [Rhodococcoides kyotonense]|uniref:Enamine deaminase RidA, house cleaning of reactive enamine intermediates, YjgF/YER057c/UK114 family n=1 Tax=Rhodococcoides kyotonense TaxID=398843 RepID=A0A239JY36_9NOCA|nr:Rid family hydrolase [Rhodococcus kyotonensis]SNT10412.1 Enamine deaminase RidA, house cleaning of reactive enamine intermediates, YjgF/YER057c/UK114 family [Rhodococcus kyotonensis]
MSTRREVIAPAYMSSLVETSNYAPAVRAGDYVYVSGQVGRDRNLVAVTSSLTDHIAAAFANLVAVLDSAGCSPDDVVELVSYHTDPAGQMATFQEQKRKHFSNSATLPAWTAVGVSALNHPDFLVEIKAVAFAPR